MKQMALAATGFDRYGKTTRRVAFLAEMERVVPWTALCSLIEPVYSKPGNGRPPVGVERMLRMYFLQHWFNLSDPGVEEALYDSLTMRTIGQDWTCRSKTLRSILAWVVRPTTTMAVTLKPNFLPSSLAW